MKGQCLLIMTPRQKVGGRSARATQRNSQPRAQNGQTSGGEVRAVQLLVAASLCHSAITVGLRARRGGMEGGKKKWVMMKERTENERVVPNAPQDHQDPVLSPSPRALARAARSGRIIHRRAAGACWDSSSLLRRKAKAIERCSSPTLVRPEASGPTRARLTATPPRRRRWPCGGARASAAPPGTPTPRRRARRP